LALVVGVKEDDLKDDWEEEEWVEPWEAREKGVEGRGVKRGVEGEEEEEKWCWGLRDLE
jgi:hypothetical protein